MLKQPVVHQEMSMADSTSKDTGFADLSLIAKYGIYRRNTPEYTFGVATTLGFELPTGADAFTSETWDIRPGLYTSWRSGPWATDFNIAYAWNGFADESTGGINPGDELSLDWALAHQFSIGEKARVSFAPVLELSYKNIWPDQLRGDNVANTGDFVLYLSPGIKFTKSSFILEALLQIPVWQEQKGSQLKRGIGGLVGTRFMF
ncbi:MAG: transporter [Thermodesulfobacteriota bacterium]